METANVAADVPHSEITVISLLNVLLRHRRLVLLPPLLALGLAFALVATRRKEYVAESRFAPQTVAQSGSGRLLGMAAQFGLAVNQSGGNSVDFYAELVNSRELLKEVASRKYAIARSPGARDSLRAPLADLVHIPASFRGDDRVNAAAAYLAGRVSASASPSVGMVTLRTTMDRPELAEAVNGQILALVMVFDVQRRNSQARSEREFVGVQLKRAQRDLADAEAALTTFLAENRRFTSPQLAAEQARLQRVVELRQQLYTTLAQSYEQARIEEVRNTPVITVVDPPQGSAVGRALPLTRSLVVALLLGVIGGCMLAFGAEYLARLRRERPAELKEFRRLLISPGRRLSDGPEAGRSEPA